MRRWRGVLLSLAAATVPISAAAQAAGRDTVTAFVHVAVAPMDRERVLDDQTVVVRGGRITAIGSARRVAIPAGAIKIDGQGKYLIPGLADMHVHAVRRWQNDIEAALFVYVANGVMTIREMHGGGRSPRENSVIGGGIANTTPDSALLALKRRLARGEVFGPRLYSAGDPDLSSPEGAARSVAELKADGHDFVKISLDARWPTPKAVYDSIIAVATRVKLPVVGHVPPGFDVTQLAAPWASAEHLYEYTEYLLGLNGRWSRTDGGMIMTMRRDLADTAAWMRPGYQLDTERLHRLTRALKRAGIWSCPTLSLLTGIRTMDTATWNNGSDLSKLLTPAVGKRYAAFDFQITKALQDAGAGLLLGTDDESPFAVHGELAALVEAGLTPYQALATGTRNVAEFLGTLDSAGTVAVGKRADLVLLSGNPLRDIGYTAGPAGVMLGGRWLSRADLDARLAALTSDHLLAAQVSAGREKIWRH